MFARIAGLLSLALLLEVPAGAQDYRAQLRGRVLNPAGVPVAGVAMRVVNEATGESRRFASDREGRYIVAGLLPGTYRIHGDDDESSAFAVRTNLSINQDLELDLRLGVVPITVSADVRPTFIPIDRHSSDQTTRIEAPFLTRLPLDGRNYLDLALLAPGVAPGSPGIVANGTFDQFTGYVLDGIYDIDPRAGVPAVRPQLDAIGEMEVRTSISDLSFGRAAGAQVNVITKSGTSRPAGGAFGFFQTDADRSQSGGFAGGPLVRSRTFLFGNYQYSRVANAFARDDGGHLLGGRLDQVFGGSARATARYGLDDERALDRRGQNFGLSLHSIPAMSLSNELRVGVTRVSFGRFPDSLPRAESQTYQLADAASWSSGRQHVVKAGAEWYGFSRGPEGGGLAASSWGVFLQNDFQVLPTVSLSAGVRYDHASPQADADDSNDVSPRAGFAWTVDRAGQTVVRGGYGVHRNYATLETVPARVDGWSLGLQRQIGRTRTFQAAYVGTRGDDLFDGMGSSRYDAMQLLLEQRSEDGISALVAYTYGEWTEKLSEDGDDVRVPLDSRHRLSAAFAAALPFGPERRWFADGLAATILGNMELFGIFTIQSGRPIPGPAERQGSAHRNLDAGLLKNVDLGDRRSLQLRAETFNLADRPNWEGRRRFQFGGRFVF